MSDSEHRPTLTCLDAIQLFSAWQLEPSTRNKSAWQQHLISCPLCAQEPELKHLLTLWEDLEDLTGPVPELSAEFEAQLLAQVEALEDKRLARRRFWQRVDLIVDWLHVPAVAAVLTLVVWLGSGMPAELAQKPNWEQNLEQTRENLQALQDMSLQEPLEQLQKIYLKRNEG